MTDKFAVLFRSRNIRMQLTNRILTFSELERDAFVALLRLTETTRMRSFIHMKVAGPTGQRIKDPPLVDECDLDLIRDSVAFAEAFASTGILCRHMQFTVKLTGEERYCEYVNAGRIGVGEPWLYWDELPTGAENEEEVTSLERLLQLLAPINSIEDAYSDRDKLLFEFSELIASGNHKELWPEDWYNAWS